MVTVSDVFDAGFGTPAGTPSKVTVLLEAVRSKLSPMIVTGWPIGVLGLVVPTITGLGSGAGPVPCAARIRSTAEPTFTRALACGDCMITTSAADAGALGSTDAPLASMVRPSARFTAGCVIIERAWLSGRPMTCGTDTPGPGAPDASALT